MSGFCILFFTCLALSSCTSFWSLISRATPGTYCSSVLRATLVCLSPFLSPQTHMPRATSGLELTPSFLLSLSSVPSPCQMHVQCLKNDCRINTGNHERPGIISVLFPLSLSSVGSSGPLTLSVSAFLEFLSPQSGLHSQSLCSLTLPQLSSSESVLFLPKASLHQRPHPTRLVSTGMSPTPPASFSASCLLSVEVFRHSLPMI